MNAVLGLVQTEALGEHARIGALHGCADARDGPVDLLTLVVRYVDLKSMCLDLRRMCRPLRPTHSPTTRLTAAVAVALLLSLLAIRLSVSVGLISHRLWHWCGAYDVWDAGVLSDALAARLHAARHDDVWLALGVGGVVPDVLGQVLGDDVDRQGVLVVIHFVAGFSEEVVNPLDDVVLGVTAQDAIQDFLTQVLDEGAPVPPDQLDALHLTLELLVGIVLHLDASVFLFPEQEHACEDAVDVDLEL
mmetsp:Transcript_38279/g.95886  ORF Transcript_38279/g.95886 Transcript_38279/m.95886 type:complete len:247 (+) Transcript_38279:477-1217(+)